MLTKKLNENELFNNMFDAFIKVKHVCTKQQFRKLGRYSTDVYYARFGKWPKVLSAFHDWLKSTGKDNDFPYMESLEKQISRIPSKSEDAKTIPQVKSSPSYPPLKVTAYGDFLNFRGLQHAPINEQGVVLLFGMVCSELGYVVEAVKPGFPDCEAKRKIAGRKDQWERVKIEFEFQSRNFLGHGHDASKCDVIVCWENNWTDCPIEVLELKTAIQGL